jgi:hypothetical protein
VLLQVRTRVLNDEFADVFRQQPGTPSSTAEATKKSSRLSPPTVLPGLLIELCEEGGRNGLDYMRRSPRMEYRLFPQRGDRARYRGRTWRVIAVFGGQDNRDKGVTLRRPARAPGWWPWRDSEITKVANVEVIR